MATAVLRRCLTIARWLFRSLGPTPKGGWQHARRDANELRVK